MTVEYKTFEFIGIVIIHKQGDILRAQIELIRDSILKVVPFKIVLKDNSVDTLIKNLLSEAATIIKNDFDTWDKIPLKYNKILILEKKVLLNIVNRVPEIKCIDIFDVIRNIACEKSYIQIINATDND